MSDGEVFLTVKDLKTHFFTDEGVVKAVNGVDLTVKHRETICIVGESGCGKSITARSILKLIDPPGRIVSGQMLLKRKDGSMVDIAALSPTGREIRSIRGNDISMIFQEPMSSLSPVHTIGDQLQEVLMVHMTISKKEAREQVLEMLNKVGIPKPSERFKAYTFELSGGMRQRAMIAMALLCRSQLLIADEPTTALDVTTQATILQLIYNLQQDMGMAVLFITHDLGVVAEIADRVAVMYLGQVVEYGTAGDIFNDPRHPYLQALLHSIPKISGPGDRLDSIEGMVPHPFRRPEGCVFHPRCRKRVAGLCDCAEPEMAGEHSGHGVKCHLFKGDAHEPST
jgi:oligopeptide/dipeptide ABC transporter ATP-binding protein